MSRPIAAVIRKLDAIYRRFLKLRGYQRWIVFTSSKMWDLRGKGEPPKLADETARVRISILRR